MPVKIARSAPRPSFGLPELLVAIQPRVSLAAKPEKHEYSCQFRESSWGIPVTIFPDERTSKALKDAKSLVQCLAAYFGTLRSGDHCALLAYLERNNR